MVWYRKNFEKFAVLRLNLSKGERTVAETTGRNANTIVVTKGRFRTWNSNRSDDGVYGVGEIIPHTAPDHFLVEAEVDGSEWFGVHVRKMFGMGAVPLRRVIRLEGDEFQRIEALDDDAIICSVSGMGCINDHDFPAGRIALVPAGTVLEIEQLRSGCWLHLGISDRPYVPYEIHDPPIGHDLVPY